jgi:hypothetical protein
MADVFDTLTLTVLPGASLPGPAVAPYTDPGGPGTLPWDGSALGVRIDGRVPDAVDRVREFLGVGRTNRSVGSTDEQTDLILAQHADDLAQRFGTRIYWVIGQDPKVKSCLLSLINGAMADTLTLSPAVAPKPNAAADAPVDPDVALAAQILAEDQEALDRLDPTIDSIVERLIRNMLHEAHAGAEILMEPAARPLAYTLAVRGVIDKPLQSWAFIVDNYNHVSGYAGSDPTGKRLYLPASKLAVMAWEPRSGDPRGTYFLRPTWVYWDFKERQLDPWFQFIDQFASPRTTLELGTNPQPRPRLVSDPPPPPGAKDTRVYPFEDAQIALSRWRSLGWFIHGNGSKVNIHNPAGSGAAYSTAIGFCDSQIVSSLLIDERSTQAVDYGSRASAEVGQDNRGLIVNKLKQIRCNFVTYILRVLNEANHGPDVAARLTPIVTVQVAEQQDQAYAVQTWVSGGWEPTQRQKQQIDGNVGLDPREAGELSIGDQERQVGIAQGWVTAGATLEVAARIAEVPENKIVLLRAVMNGRTAAESTMVGDGAAAGFDDGSGEPASPFDDSPPGGLAWFAAKLKGLTGGRWVTLKRRRTAAKAKSGKSTGRGLRLYISGSGKNAGKVIAGAGASPDNPKSVGNIVQGLRSTPPGETPLPDYGPSTAKVTHRDYTAKEMTKEVRKTLGPDASLRDVASAVGAPKGATVNLSEDATSGINVRVSGANFNAERRIYKDSSGDLVIKNEFFGVEPGSRGKGIGADVFGRQVEQASSLGVKKIRTEAAGSADDLAFNGYKVWPRFGYDGNIPKKVNDSVASGSIPKPPGNPTRVSHLMASPEGRQWWDNHGSTFDAEFDLTPGSYSRNTWDGYRRSKK